MFFQIKEGLKFTEKNQHKNDLIKINIKDINNITNSNTKLENFLEKENLKLKKENDLLKTEIDAYKLQNYSLIKIINEIKEKDRNNINNLLNFILENKNKLNNDDFEIINDDKNTDDFVNKLKSFIENNFSQ